MLEKVSISSDSYAVNSLRSDTTSLIYYHISLMTWKCKCVESNMCEVRKHLYISHVPVPDLCIMFCPPLESQEISI